MRTRGVLEILVVLLAFVVAIVTSSSPSCSVRFASTTGAGSRQNFVATEIEPNTFHVQVTHNPNNPQLDPENEEDEEIDDFLKRHFGKRSNIPPAAIFECSSSHFFQFKINSVEAVRFIEVERSRIITPDYAPLTSPDDYVNFLRVQVLLDANATGEYEFYSKNGHVTESFYIFAETEPVSLLGVDRSLTAVPTGNNLTLPCVSPNPKSPMYLWTADSKEGGFDEVPVDNTTVFYDRKKGFILTGHSRFHSRLGTGYFRRFYRCTVEKPWHVPQFVEINVLQTGVQHHPDLSINLLKSGGAECYGIPGSDVKLYKVSDATEDDAPEIIKCFEQRKLDCGEGTLGVVEVGSPLHPDPSGKASVSVLRFSDSSGLLVCTSETETISTMFFQGLDEKYYGNEIHNVPIDILLRIQLIPDPDKEVIIGGSVLTVTTEEAPDIFVDSPRLVFIKFRNGSTTQVQVVQKGGSPKNLLVTPDMTGVLVNDQFLNSGRTINLLKSFAVKQRECGVHQFRCESGECIAIGKVCDHRIHCRDGKSDEFNCQKFTRNCTRDEFKCASGQCIAASLQCSGTHECFDGTDENNNCSACGQDRFRCKNGECIRNTYVCDSDPDCGDDSDETEALCHDCNGDEDKFKCGKGGCIPKDRVCDGYSNCEDGSDEGISACTDETPKIVNEENLYEFPLHKDNYLVCEVIIPQHQAEHQRFQPHVNWTFTPSTYPKKHGAPRRPLHISKNKKPTPLKLDPKGRALTTNFTTFYFAYKLRHFDESKEGVYRCTAYNELGSQYRDLLAWLTRDSECAPTSPRPGHENRPEVIEEEEGGSGSDPPEKFQCPGTGKYADPTKCAVFHDCVRNGQGYSDYRFNCAPGTVFCPESQNCGWEATCPCSSKRQ